MSVPAEIELVRKSRGYWTVGIEKDSPEYKAQTRLAAVEIEYAVQHMARNDYLAKVARANPQSVYMAMQNVAAVGLTLNPAEHLAYLVPRKIEGTACVCFDPSYQGLLRLATDSGSIRWCHADVFRDGDVWTDNGIGEKPVHQKASPFTRPGNIVGAYCVAKTSEGDYMTQTMTLEELHQIRDGSEMWKKNKAGPWKDHESEMMKKTVLRRAFKTWPRSVQGERLAIAVDASNQNEGFEPLPQTSPDLGLVSDSTKEALDQALTDGDGLALLLIREASTEREWTNLYHSFEKGTKGKYQGLLDTLTNGAQAQVAEYRTILVDCHAAADELGIQELLAEMSEDEVRLALVGMPDDVARDIKEMHT